MGYQAGLSIYSPFSQKLAIAREASRSKPKQELTPEQKERQKEVRREWQQKRRAENLAQRALVESRR